MTLSNAFIKPSLKIEKDENGGVVSVKNVCLFKGEPYYTHLEKRIQLFKRFFEKLFFNVPYLSQKEKPDVLFTVHRAEVVF